jgi:hypothetical protein
MKALDSRSAWIDYQHVVSLRITNHFQNMRMAAYEYVRFIPVYQLTGTRVISARISAHMGHQDLHPFALEESMERMLETQGMIVAVAGHAHQRLERSNLCSQVHSPSEVTGMPYLVDRLKEFLEPSVEHTVRI